MRIGLVERILRPKSCWNAAMEMPGTISENAPLRFTPRNSPSPKFSRTRRDRDMDAIRKIGDVCMDSEDFREGRRASWKAKARKFHANKILLCDPPALPQGGARIECRSAQRSRARPQGISSSPPFARRARISYAPMVPAVRWGLAFSRSER